MERERLRFWLICTLVISLIAITIYYSYFVNNEAEVTDGTLVRNEYVDTGVML